MPWWEQKLLKEGLDSEGVIKLGSDPQEGTDLSSASDNDLSGFGFQVESIE